MDCCRVSVIDGRAAAFLGEHGAYVDPHLLSLAQSFVAASQQARAVRTIKKYEAPWRAFATWISQRTQPFDVFNVPGQIVALYLLEVKQQSELAKIGPSRVLAASAAIACTYALQGLPSPTDHRACSIVREAAKRSLHGTKYNRDEVDLLDIRLLIDSYAGPTASLSDLMYVTAFTVMYAAFLRFDDMCEVSVHSDMLVIEPDFMKIFLLRSKTDSYAVGKWVVVSRVPGPYCPVALVERLLVMGQYRRLPLTESEDVGPLLRPCQFLPSSKTSVLKQVVGTLQHPILATKYDTVLKQCKKMCKAVGITANITMHSFRIGGVSAALEKGVPDRLCKKHGRWESDMVKDHYAREAIGNLLKVSRAVFLGETD